MVQTKKHYILHFTNMTNKFIKPSRVELEHSLEDKKINAGFFGKYFGVGDIAKINVTAICVLLLILSSIIFSFCFDFQHSIEYWKIVSPFITLGLGYIWGKN